MKFKNITYKIYLSNPTIHSHIQELLLNHGATENLDNPSHIITNDNGLLPKPFKNCIIVKPEWVYACIQSCIGCINEYGLVNPKLYSPLKELLFSGMVFSINTQQISLGDCEMLQDMISKLGGQVVPFPLGTVSSESHDCITHFITLGESESWYEFAKANEMTCVLPHYIEDCFKLSRPCSMDLYTFPDPKILCMELGQQIAFLNSKKRMLPSPDYNTMFLKGHVFYFDLSIESMTRTNLGRQLMTFGAKIETDYKGDNVTCVILKHRAGFVYVDSETRGHFVGSVYWIEDMILYKEFTAPKSKLVHYPIPDYTIPRMKEFYISVSGYSGQSRVDIERMCAYIGATFTKFFTEHHSHLICAFTSGEKYEKAAKWNTHVVNILWLEECFYKWDCMREAQSRFVTFNTGVESGMGLSDVSNWISLAHCKLTPLELSRLYTVEPDVSLPIQSLPLEQPPQQCSDPQEQSSDQPEEPQEPQPVEQVKENRQEQKESTTTPNKHINNTHKRSQDMQTHSRKRNKVGNYKIIFTGYRPSEEMIQFIQNHKGILTTNVEDSTHLVAEKIARTEKLLVAIGLRKNIVSIDWIKESMQVGHFKDECEYPLRDSIQETSYNFTLETSLVRSKFKKLLEGMTFMSSPSVHPFPSILKKIIRASGGKFIDNPKKDKDLTKEYQEFAKKVQSDPLRFIMISTLVDNKLTLPFRKVGVPLYTSEFLLTGLLRQELSWNVYKV